MPGIDLTQSVIRQMPVPKPSTYDEQIEYLGVEQSLETHILSRVCAILIREPIVASIVEPFKGLVEKFINYKLHILRKEIDELFAIAYGFNNEEYEKVLANFKVNNKNTPF
jgi:hypothetical protein